MAKYIERDALIEWLKRIPLIDLSDGRELCRVIMEDDFKKAITKMPKGIIVDIAPDAVPVVRCLECKFGTHFGDMEDEWIRCMNLHGNPLMPFDGFCSYGERKEGADNA